MKKYALLFGSILLFMVAGTASAATSAGRFYCGPSCTFDDSFAYGDTYTFIWTTVNAKVQKWTDSDGAPKIVTICNGSQCAIFKYVLGSGQHVKTGYFYSTWTGSPPPPAPPGGGGGGGSTWGVVGYTPVYVNATVCTGGGCHSEMMLIGFDAIYGWKPGNDYRAER